MFVFVQLVASRSFKVYNTLLTEHNYPVSQDLNEHKASIVPFEPRQSRFGLFRRCPTLKFTEAEQLRDEVFLIAKV